MQALSLDIKVLDENGDEIELSKIGEDDLETPNYVSGDSDISEEDVGESVATDDLFDSYTEEESDDEPTDEQFEAAMASGLGLDDLDDDF